MKDTLIQASNTLGGQKQEFHLTVLNIIKFCPSLIKFTLNTWAKECDALGGLR